MSVLVIHTVYALTCYISIYCTLSQRSTCMYYDSERYSVVTRHVCKCTQYIIGDSRWSGNLSVNKHYDIFTEKNLK